MSDNRVQNELVLNPGEFAYLQDLTSGILKVHTGPSVLNVSGQEYPVCFDSKTGRFRRVSLAEAAQQFVIAQQGQYVVLSNPAIDGVQPTPRDKKPAADLNHGQRVTVQGPATFALWPGQMAEVIDGHNLRSNQYLIIRVRDEELARKNWSKGVVKALDNSTDASVKRPTNIFLSVPEDLAVGKHYIVRGDQFSFYIPPTGVDVIRDEVTGYVRDAVTLERLEYCILIDENGNKRYERGPMVVFPAPTERFHEAEDARGNKRIVFQPIELNALQGINVKVISQYTDDDGTVHNEGEELFITGATTPIYFPRPEHSIVAYDKRQKHYATAIPAGQGRYVLDRMNGTIKTVKGPNMLLPDPRTEVFVRRVLTEKECKLWYPNNNDVLKFNAALRELEPATSSTRGVVTEGEVTRSKKVKASGVSFNLNDEFAGMPDRSRTHSDTNAVGTDEFERGATYNEPRQLTFGSRMSGVPTIDLWTGYAVMVVTIGDDVKPNRRVEVGPKRLLLNHDETLQALSMSTGKPKNTDNLIQTVYLRVKNNQISDVINAETRDHVNVEFKVSLRGDFTGDPSRWFDVENYVKLVSDHVRSVVKAAVRRKTIEELYADPTSVVRDTVLGQKGEQDRPGMMFEENGFVVNEVELLGFAIPDARIAQILQNTQHQVVESNIAVALLEKKIQIEKRQEALEQERVRAASETQKVKLELNAEYEKLVADLAKTKTQRDLELVLGRIDAKNKELDQQKVTLAVELEIADKKHAADLERISAKADLDRKISEGLQELALAKTREETQSIISRFNAAAGPFSEALLAMQNQEVMVKVAEAMSIQNYIGGPNLVTALRKVFEGTPIDTIAQNMLTKAVPQKTPNGTTGGATGDKLPSARG